MPKRYRKPVHQFNLVQVKVCGTTISKKHNVICTLPPGHAKGIPVTHAAVAIEDDGNDEQQTIRAVIRRGEEVLVCELRPVAKTE